MGGASRPDGSRGGPGSAARTGAVGAVAIGVVAVLLASCGSGHTGPTNDGATQAGGAAAHVTKIAISISPDGCAPEPPSVPEGATEFDIENKNADAVSTAQLRSADGTRILDEKPRLTPGHSGSFTRTLSAGSYRIRCPGAQQDTWDLRVTGPDAADSWHDDPDLVAAVKGYAEWVRQKIADLVTNTATFVAAVKAGQIDQAKILYGKARIGYERVEPVAEAFGDLDTEIDGRIDDFLDPAKFSGFHRLERALFAEKSLIGMSPIANRLDQNVRQLQRLVAKQGYSPIELASGATELVNEIEESKITGEEERYSGVDLIDFRGNLEGATELVHELSPFLRKHEPALLATINTRDAAVNAALAKYEAKPGYVQSGFVNYSAVTDPERRQLSAVINSLAEDLSELVVVVSK